MLRLELLASAPTLGQRTPCFPEDQSIEPIRPSVLRAVDTRVARCTAAWRGPERRAAETAAALGVDAVPVPELGAWSAGDWAGMTLEVVARDEPEAFRLWRTDPDFAPNGGESLTRLLARVRGWLQAHGPDDGRVLVIADPAVVRAAVVHALAAGPETFWHVDVGPLSMTRLHHVDGSWRVRSLNVDLAGAQSVT